MELISEKINLSKYEYFIECCDSDNIGKKFEIKLNGEDFSHRVIGLIVVKEEVVA